MAFYTLTLADDIDTMTFTLLQTPITDEIIEGATDNTTLDGNIYTDFIYAAKTHTQSWKIMKADEYAKLRGFYERQFADARFPRISLPDLGIADQPARIQLTDGGIINACGDRQNIKLTMRETAQQ